MIATTTTTSEILHLHPTTIIVQSSSWYSATKKVKIGGKVSGIVLLFLAIQSREMRKYIMLIDTNLSYILRATKANIMKKGAASHYNSTGNYYYFGNKDSYKKVGNSLVSQYTSKGYKLVERSKFVMNQAMELEELCASHIK